MHRIFNLIGKKEKTKRNKVTQEKQPAAAHSVRCSCRLSSIILYALDVFHFLCFYLKMNSNAVRCTEYCTSLEIDVRNSNLDLLQSKICQEYIVSVCACVVRICSRSIFEHTQFQFGFLLFTSIYQSFIERCVFSSLAVCDSNRDSWLGFLSVNERASVRMIYVSCVILCRCV